MGLFHEYTVSYMTCLTCLRLIGVTCELLLFVINTNTPSISTRLHTNYFSSLRFFFIDKFLSPFFIFIYKFKQSLNIIHIIQIVILLLQFISKGGSIQEVEYNFNIDYKIIHELI